MSTHMQELGIPADIIDKCQAHAVENVVRRIYQRAELKTLMAEAWQRWGQHLHSLLVQAHEELKAELSKKAQDEPDGVKPPKASTKQRSIRAGRGALGQPLLDMMAPYAPHQQETHDHG